LDKAAGESNCAIGTDVHGLVQVVHCVVVLREQDIVRHSQVGQLCIQQAVLAAQLLMLLGNPRSKKHLALRARFQLQLNWLLIHDVCDALKSRSVEICHHATRKRLLR
jgi:hypothetical protein